MSARVCAPQDGHEGLRPIRQQRSALLDMTVIDPRRSANMARIGPRDTAPELAVRRALHRLGYRFRLHRSDLPGTPDVVLPRHRTIFLIHGCFWHRHRCCRFAYSPKSRVGFWEGKFKRNVIRDRKVERELREDGWLVHTIWECETRDPSALEARLRKMLTGEQHEDASGHCGEVPPSC